MTPTDPDAQLVFRERPAALSCARPGCGRKPLCGFLSTASGQFYCCACLDSGLVHDTRRSPPRFRSPEERRKILEGSPR
jgi:hypothetical protein